MAAADSPDRGAVRASDRAGNGSPDDVTTGVITIGNRHIRALWRIPAIQRVFILVAMLPFVSTLFLYNLADLSSYHIDEILWIPYGNYVFHLLFIQGDITSSFWGDDFYTYGAYNPPIGKYLIGLGTYTAGYDFVPFIQDYDWQRSIEWNIAQGHLHNAHIRATARFPIALTAVSTCLLLYWLVARLTTVWHGVGTVAALLSGRLFLVNGRSAMLDVPAVCFTLLGLVLLFPLVAALRAGRIRVALIWAIGCGIACGLAVGTKLTGGLAIIASIAVLAFEWAIACKQGRATVWPWICSLLIGTFATAVFIASNPFLYPDPVGGIRHMLSFTAVMQATTGSIPPNDLLGKLAAVVDQLLIYAPFHQVGLSGDAIVLLVGLVALAATCRNSWRACWERQISTVLVWIAVTFVGITVWLPIAYPRYTLPLHLWSAFVFSYGAIWLLGAARRIWLERSAFARVV